MVILTQIAKKCEILLSPIFGSCLAAYISQKSGQPQVFSLFFPLFLPHLFHYSPCNGSSSTTSSTILSGCHWDCWSVRTVGMGAGVVLVVIFPGESLLLSLSFLQLTFLLLPFLPLVSLFPLSFSGFLIFF